MKTRIDNRGFSEPYESAVICSSRLPQNCFQLIDSKLSGGFGRILADAKYLLCDNKTGKQGVVSGAQLFDVLSVYDKHRFIPSVLARCTIIPV